MPVAVSPSDSGPREENRCTPYAVLTAMTIPAIFYSTGSVATAAFGTAVALLLAYFDMPLIVVALAASAAAFAAGWVLPYIGL